MADVRVALIGSGRMGAFHGETLARRIPERGWPRWPTRRRARPSGWRPSWARTRAYTDAAEAFADPEVDAVVIAAPARFHADLVVAAAAAGKGVFCEKPMALTLADADRAIDAARAAGVVLQVGFNRRFAADWRAARALLDDGRLGTPRLLRSVTRDPGGFDPSRVAPDTIFNETLIHDFDTLRFLNPGAEAVEVYATADALVEPDWRDRGPAGHRAGRRDTFDNGAIGVAEACFEAAYGYDVRGEVFGSGGMATMGDGRRTGMVFSGAAGRLVDTVRSDQELLPDAYVAELAAFVDAVRAGTPAAGRRARTPAPRWRSPWPPPSRCAPGARSGSTRWRSELSGWRSPPRWCSSTCRSSSGSGGSPTRASRWRSGTGPRRTSTRSPRTGATFSSMTGYITGTLADPDGAEELLRTAEQSLKVAEKLDCPRLNVHGTGLDGRACRCVPTEVVTPAMWLHRRDAP